MTVASWLGIRPRRERLAVHAAYRRVVEQARVPLFFTELGVPDTLDGRFEVLTLHLFLVLNRLKGQSDAGEFAQALVDSFVADMDRSLREMGASDLGVGRRVRAMAEGFYGRIAAYERGLAKGEAELTEALSRNLYGTISTPPAGAMDAVIRYIGRQRTGLALVPLERLLRGEIPFLRVDTAAGAGEAV